PPGRTRRLRHHHPHDHQSLKVRRNIEGFRGNLSVGGRSGVIVVQSSANPVLHGGMIHGCSCLGRWEGTAAMRIAVTSVRAAITVKAVRSVGAVMLVVMMARPTAPPNCLAVFIIPDAAPASAGPMPEVTRVARGVLNSPAPRPMMSAGARTTR